VFWGIVSGEADAQTNVSAKGNFGKREFGALPWFSVPAPQSIRTASAQTQARLMILAGE
jgi:hypothetical protein